MVDVVVVFVVLVVAVDPDGQRTVPVDAPVLASH